MKCVKKYPAHYTDYLIKINGRVKSPYVWENAISDHTTDLELFSRTIHPEYFEMHYALKDQTGLDVESLVCKTPEMLAEIL
jgi:sialic acid synthase SpsE